MVDPPGWDMPGSEGIGESSRAGAAGGVYGIGYGWNADKGRGNTAEQDAPAAAHEASASSGEPRLRAEQANLNHKRVMHVVEGAELTAGPSGYVSFLQHGGGIQDQDQDQGQDRRADWLVGCELSGKTKSCVVFGQAAPDTTIRRYHSMQIHALVVHQAPLTCTSTRILAPFAHII